METKAKNTEHKTYMVINAIVARKLLQKGYQITDLKPARFDKTKTVFIFKSEGNIDADCRELHDIMFNRNK